MSSLLFSEFMKCTENFVKNKGSDQFHNAVSMQILKKLGFERKRTKNGNVWFAILDEKA